MSEKNNQKKRTVLSAKAKNIIVNFSTQYGRKSFSYPQSIAIKSLQVFKKEGVCDGTCARLREIIMHSYHNIPFLMH